jgi:Tol biopolymer transport system component
MLDDNEHNIPGTVWNIYSINLDGSNQKELAENGGIYLLASDNIIYGYISSMNLDGSNQHVLQPANLDPVDFSVSPDGTKIIFFADQILYLMNANGRNIYQITIPDSTLKRTNPSLSYDNKNIVFECSNGIYQINVNGENYIKLKNNPGKTSYTQPAFSPDNNNIIFAEYNDSTINWIALHYFNLASLQDTIIYRFSKGAGFYFEVSPHYTILFTTGSNIHELNINTLVDKIVTTGSDAHYSPDFSKITYIDPTNTFIDLIDLKTNIITGIKTSFSYYEGISLPRLSPDGTKIIFEGATSQY